MKRICSVFILMACSAALFAGAIDWEKADLVQKGVRLVKLELTSPRLMKVYIMRVDLSTPGLEFTATGRDPDWGKPMPDYPQAYRIRAKRLRTSDFMIDARKSGKKMIAAANAAPWSPWVAPYDHKYSDPAGLCISDGIVLSDNGRQSAEFVVYKDGKCDIVKSIPAADYGKVHVAAAGFAILMLDGKRFEGGGYEKSLQPRMAFGLSADRRYLYLIAVDGRQEGWSLGATGDELSDLFTDAGAADAINMDGGGSATLCFWNEKASKPVVVNRHCDNGYTRPVGSNIGVWLK
ncbi:MAG: phosphodiester glycosidase family protein [Victivallaceae bacterium]|nr:phosphodiester glycosidase family protein [Victivallaceae bacterium]